MGSSSMKQQQQQLQQQQQQQWRSQSRWSFSRLALLALAMVALSSRAVDADQCSMAPAPLANLVVNSTYGVTQQSGVLPAAGNCISWTLHVPNGSGDPCADPDGQMQLELWILDSHGSAIDPRTTLPGIYLAVSRASAPVANMQGGGTSFTPSLAFGPDAAYTSTYIDVDSVLAESGIQRVFMPVGALYNTGFMGDAFTWYMSLSNMNADLPANLRFVVRATCALSAYITCPRAAPGYAECSGNGTCTATNTTAATCNCFAGFAGLECGTRYTDLTTSFRGVPQLVDVPPQQWRYYKVTVPAAGDAKLLAELSKAAGSIASYMPVLQMVKNRLPSISDIDTSQLNLNQSCTCSSCNCYMPYQAQDLAYQLERIPRSATDSDWFVGVYNHLLPSQAVTPTNLLTIKVSYTTGDPIAAALCPQSCSGVGICSNPAVSSLSTATYSCACSQGFGGPYCQGPISTATLSDASRSYDSGQVSLQPGAWSFLRISTMASGTMTLQWEETSSSSPLFFIFGPMYSTSYGEDYFLASKSWVFNRSTGVQIPATVSGNVGEPIGWIVGILNSDAVAPVQASYNVAIGLPAGSSLSFLSTLQMALIGAVSGLIVALLLFMAIRLFLMRRAMSRLTPEELAAYAEQNGGQVGPRRALTQGVPVHIVQTFPTFAYQAEEFEASRESRQQAVAKAALTMQPMPATPPVKRSSAPGTGEPPRDRPSSRSSRPVSGSGAIAAAAVAAPPEHPAKSKIDEDAPQCSVCICDYEEGEMLRRLPCMHIFHQSCIDQWMGSHNTCPNCRIHLCPAWAAMEETNRRGSRRRNNATAPEPGPTPEGAAAAATGEMQMGEMRPSEAPSLDWSFLSGGGTTRPPPMHGAAPMSLNASEDSRDLRGFTPAPRSPFNEASQRPPSGGNGGARDVTTPEANPGLFTSPSRSGLSAASPSRSGGIGRFGPASPVPNPATSPVPGGPPGAVAEGTSAGPTRQAAALQVTELTSDDRIESFTRAGPRKLVPQGLSSLGRRTSANGRNSDSSRLSGAFNRNHSGGGNGP